LGMIGECRFLVITSRLYGRFFLSS
jgi:hypothetical protein